MIKGAGLRIHYEFCPAPLSIGSINDVPIFSL